MECVKIQSFQCNLFQPVSLFGVQFCRIQFMHGIMARRKKWGKLRRWRYGVVEEVRETTVWREEDLDVIRLKTLKGFRLFDTVIQNNSILYIRLYLQTRKEEHKGMS